MNYRPTPETDAAKLNHSYGVVDIYFARKLEQERDEARSIAAELAAIASYCLGWHDHESTDTAIKIAAALKRWKKSK